MNNRGFHAVTGLKGLSDQIRSDVDSCYQLRAEGDLQKYNNACELLRESLKTRLDTIDAFIALLEQVFSGPTISGNGFTLFPKYGPDQTGHPTHFEYWRDQAEADVLVYKKDKPAELSEYFHQRTGAVVQIDGATQTDATESKHKHQQTGVLLLLGRRSESTQTDTVSTRNYRLQTDMIQQDPDSNENTDRNNQYLSAVSARIATHFRSIENAILQFRENLSALRVDETQQRGAIFEFQGFLTPNNFQRGISEQESLTVLVELMDQNFFTIGRLLEEGYARQAIFEVLGANASFYSQQVPRLVESLSQGLLSRSSGSLRPLAQEAGDEMIREDRSVSLAPMTVRTSPQRILAQLQLNDWYSMDTPPRIRRRSDAEFHGREPMNAFLHVVIRRQSDRLVELQRQVDDLRQQLENQNHEEILPPNNNNNGQQGRNQ